MTSTTRLVLLIGIVLVIQSIIMLGAGAPMRETYFVVGTAFVVGAVWNWVFDTEEE